MDCSLLSIENLVGFAKIDQKIWWDLKKHLSLQHTWGTVVSPVTLTKTVNNKVVIWII